MGVKVNILEDGESIEVLAFGVVQGHKVIQAQSEIYDEKHLSKKNIT